MSRAATGASQRPTANVLANVVRRGRVGRADQGVVIATDSESASACQTAGRRRSGSALWPRRRTTSQT
jgi:hypothetical protein